MSMSDTLGDMLTRIRNGQTTNKKIVDAPASRFRKNVLEVLKREGYIRNFSEKELKPGISFLEIELKYYNFVLGLPGPGIAMPLPKIYFVKFYKVF